MNLNNISTAPAPVESIALGSKTPATDSKKIAATEKIKNLTSERQDNNFSAEDAKQLAAEMNEIMDDFQTSLGFSIREDLGHLVIVEIKDRDTNELIKQIPSEEMLAIKEKMEELTGLLLDQSV